MSSFPSLIRKKKTAIPQGDFRVENHGSIFLIHPLNRYARTWVDKNVGRDNGFQPYWPVVVVEPRYLVNFVSDIHRDRLVTRE